MAGPFPEALLPYELVVATVNVELPKWPANQLLIAAAPELLEFITRWENEISDGGTLDNLQGWQREFCEEARAALAKATGQNL